MRLLVADKLKHGPLEELEMLGVTVVHRPELSSDELAGALGDIDVLVVRSTKVPAVAIRSAPKLSLIVRAGHGVNTIDVATASERGIYVANCPGKNAHSVAELTMGLILALDRRIVDATQSLRDGRWDRGGFQGGRGLYGRRLGVAGVGGIGRLVIERAQAFGMEVYAWSRSLTPTKASRLGVHHCVSLEALAASSDVLTLHLPSTAATQKIVDRQVLEALPHGATLINTARAAILDYDALAEMMDAKQLRVGLDVFADEPKSLAGDFDSALVNRGLVYATPHIAATSNQAQLAVASEVTRIVRRFLTDTVVPNVVNVARATKARYAIVLRARNEVGVLAHVLNVLKRHGLNVEQVSNTMFTAATAACLQLSVSARPGDDCLQEILAFDEVFHVSSVALPNLA